MFPAPPDGPVVVLHAGPGPGAGNKVASRLAGGSPRRCVCRPTPPPLASGGHRARRQSLRGHPTPHPRTGPACLLPPDVVCQTNHSRVRKSVRGRWSAGPGVARSGRPCGSPVRLSAASATRWLRPGPAPTPHAETRNRVWPGCPSAPPQRRSARSRDTASEPPTGFSVEPA
jgi:hypothetical protein